MGDPVTPLDTAREHLADALLRWLQNPWPYTAQVLNAAASRYQDAREEG